MAKVKSNEAVKRELTRDGTVEKIRHLGETVLKELRQSFARKLPPCLSGWLMLLTRALHLLSSCPPWQALLTRAKLSVLYGTCCLFSLAFFLPPSHMANYCLPEVRPLPLSFPPPLPKGSVTWGGNWVTRIHPSTLNGPWPLQYLGKRSR